MAREVKDIVDASFPGNADRLVGTAFTDTQKYAPMLPNGHYDDVPRSIARNAEQTLGVPREKSPSDRLSNHSKKQMIPNLKLKT